MSLATCPHDVLYLIFEEACTLDAGPTARALSLTSRYVSLVVSPFLYRTVAVRGIAQVHRARTHFLTLPAEQHKVRNLLVSDLAAEYMHILPSLPTSPTERSVPDLQLRGKWGSEQAHKFQQEVDALLVLLSPSLRTLACLTRNPWQPFILCRLDSTPFPCLTSLILSQHSRIPLRSYTPISETLCMPQLRRLHLSYNGTGYIDFQVGGVVRLFAHGCPQLAWLRLSDVDFYFGGKDALARMLAEMLSVRMRQRTADENAACVPQGVKGVVLQLVKSMRPSIEEQDARALHAMRDDFAGFLVLDDIRLLRTFEEWREEWLKVARSGYSAWEEPGKPSRAQSIRLRLFYGSLT
ncbi:hypothetical protein K488DRAFT_86375 [Vararia minispora EC-137]|uniref:Uncharacterized protein n=1 Tax=Vararia minispora EC-137 TaxID=1314806 RepID=A0ACB8QJV0_9AGAM|nr:hypothetical protein K488DRAFT_86375 [Vararia minispora EC-137]